MWDLKCTNIPVMTGATGISTERLGIFGSHNSKRLNRFTTKYSYNLNITLIRKVLLSGN